MSAFSTAGRGIVTATPPPAEPADTRRLDIGRDDNGLIGGFLLATGTAARPLDTDAARRWLAARAEGFPQAGGAFAWLHFNLAHTGAERWLREHAGLDETFFEALHEGSRATRIERVRDSVFAVLNDVTYDFAFEASNVATLWLSAREHLVVTARRSPLRSVDRLRAAVVRGHHSGGGPASLLDHLLREQADELQRIARKASDRVDEIEDGLLAGRTLKLTGELAQLRRMSVRLQRLLAPEPAAFFRMLANTPSWLPEAERQQLRQASEEFAVVMRDLGALQDRTKLLQEESAARVAEQNNRSLFTLTMVTVLALPINLISGLLGMNVGGIPFQQEGHGFWVVLSIIVAVTGAIAWLALRRTPRD